LEGKLVNKSQLIDTLAARFDGNRKAAAHALESVLDTITREVAKGEKVAITGFGSFEKRVRNARTVRNPQTGQTMKSKKKSVPKFTPGADLKNVISGAKKLPKLTVAAAVPGAKKATAPARKAASVAKSAAKKTTAKKSTAKKSTAKKSTAKKSAGAKKTAAKKSTGAKKTAAKKGTAAKKSTARKSTAAKKSTAKKTSAAKKSTARKSPAKKTAKKTAAKRTTGAKKTAARKAPAKKSTAKKSTARKRTAKKS
jgi:DNA-binding protein HU-beta